MCAHLVTVAMGCLSGTDESKGSTPKAALIVITEIKQPIRKKARVSVSGDSFMVGYRKRFASSELSITSNHWLGLLAASSSRSSIAWS